MTCHTPKNALCAVKNVSFHVGSLDASHRGDLPKRTHVSAVYHFIYEDVVKVVHYMYQKNIEVGARMRHEASCVMRNIAKQKSGAQSIWRKAPFGFGKERRFISSFLHLHSS